MAHTIKVVFFFTIVGKDLHNLLKKNNILSKKFLTTQFHSGIGKGLRVKDSSDPSV